MTTDLGMPAEEVARSHDGVVEVGRDHGHTTQQRGVDLAPGGCGEPVAQLPASSTKGAVEGTVGISLLFMLPLPTSPFPFGHDDRR